MLQVYAIDWHNVPIALILLWQMHTRARYAYQMNFARATYCRRASQTAGDEAGNRPYSNSCGG